MLALAAVLAGCSIDAATPGPAGTVDLRGIGADEVVRLDGGWRARADDGGPAPTAFSLDDRAWRAVHAEGSFVEQGFPDEGGVWYRLRVRLPAGVRITGTIPMVGGAQRLYAARPDGRVVRLAESGEPGSRGRGVVLSRRPAYFALPDAPELVLVWHVANAGYFGGGPYHAPRVGTAVAIQRRTAATAARVFGTVGVYAVLALAFGIVWARQRANVQALAVMLLAYVLGLRTLATSGALDLLFPGLSFDGRVTVEAVSQFGLFGGVALLLWAFFPLEFAPIRVGARRLAPPIPDVPGRSRRAPRWLRLTHTFVVVAAVVASIVFTAAAVALPPAGLAVLLVPARWFTALLIAGAVSVATSALTFGRPGARFVSGGLFVVAAAGVHDLLIAWDVVTGAVYLVTYAFLLFLVALGVALARTMADYAHAASESNRLLTERVARRTRELQAATVAAQAASIAKTHFLTTVSHELRTPLASMMGYTQILQEELTPVANEEQREFLGVISRSGERLLSLINDLLDLSKIEAGRFELHREAVALAPALREVVQQLYPLAQEKGLRLTLRADVADDALVEADGVRLRQVLVNLVSNAVKFTAEGSVTLSATAATLRGAPAVALAVTDTGVGISEAFRPHLFERFAQDARLYDQTQRGTGLGLAITRELVVRMEGTIDVESEEGAGSTFTVTLRRAEG